MRMRTLIDEVMRTLMLTHMHTILSCRPKTPVLSFERLRVRMVMARQLDSFDEFIMNTMQEIVDEAPRLELVPQQQHNPTMHQSGDVSYVIHFGQIYLSKPT